jgi:serine/threonine protein phosphatase PrpC
MKITEATAQGPLPYQEDRKIVYQDMDGNTLLAVFDGHGGDTAAVLAASSLVDSYLTRQHCENKIGILTGIFEDLDFVTSASESGTTASIVYINPNQDKAYVAVLGDSPVLICGKEGLIVSPEHNIRSNAVELSRAVQRGGYEFNGYVFGPSKNWNEPSKGLQMSRALGDRDLRQILSQKPETYSVNLDGDSYVLVATDGLFDPKHQDVDAANRIHDFIVNGKVNANALVDYALTHLNNDNVTVILAHMNDTADVLFAFGNNLNYSKTERTSSLAA